MAQESPLLSEAGFLIQSKKSILDNAFSMSREGVVVLSRPPQLSGAYEILE